MGYSYTLIDDQGLTLKIETAVPVPTDVLLSLEDVRGITDQGIIVRSSFRNSHKVLRDSDEKKVLDAYLSHHIKAALWLRECDIVHSEYFGGMNVVTVVQDYVKRKLDGARW